MGQQLSQNCDNINASFIIRTYNNIYNTTINSSTYNLSKKYTQQECELRREKTGHKIIVIVIPKEVFGVISPTKPFFGMTPTIELYALDSFH